MNNQEVFNTVRSHLLMQMKRSAYEGSKCAYRGDFERTCSVGCLIPEDTYVQEMEGLSIRTIIQRFPKIQKLFANVDENLLQSLQFVHDECSPKEWADELEITRLAWRLEDA